MGKGSCKILSHLFPTRRLGTGTIWLQESALGSKGEIAKGMCYFTLIKVNFDSASSRCSSSLHGNEVYA